MEPLAPVRTMRLKAFAGKGLACPPGRHALMISDDTGARELCMCRSISARRSSLLEQGHVTQAKRRRGEG